MMFGGFFVVLGTFMCHGGFDFLFNYRVGFGYNTHSLRTVYNSVVNIIR
jgi:hypothetical protein